MAYDKEITAEVLRDLEQLRADREQLFQQRHAEIYQRIPRVREIDDELRNTAARVVRTALAAGNDPTAAVQSLRERNLSLQREQKILLVEHGYPPDYLTPSPSCSLCGDLGYIGTTPCRCLQERYAKKLTERLSTILPIGSQNFDTFDFNYYSDTPDSRIGISPRENIEYNYDICVDYTRSFGKHHRNLLLYGSAGLGKTFLSSCIAKGVSDGGFSVAYDTAISIFGYFEAEKFGGARSSAAAQQLQKYHDADLLIIDDLGTELSTSFTVSALYGLLNGRLMAERSMILNTNLVPSALEKRYGPAISSRILGEFTQLRFFGADIRLQKRKISE